MRKFIFAILMLLPLSTPAQNLRSITPLRSCLLNVSLNAAAADRTFKWPCVIRGQPRDASGYDTAVLTVHYTHANNGTITFTCTNSDDGGVTQITPTLCPSGTCADSGVFVTDAALTADKSYSMKISIMGLSEGQCVVSHGGSPDAGDIISAYWRMFTDGGGPQ